MTDNDSNLDKESTLDVPAEAGPIGKPSQAEGDDDTSTEKDDGPNATGKPSQAEGDAGDFEQG